MIKKQRKNIFTDEDDDSTSDSLATRKGSILDRRSTRKLNNSLAPAIALAVNFSQHDEEYYGAGEHKFCNSDHKFYDNGNFNEVYNEREFDNGRQNFCGNTQLLR